ncbi:class I SAM-dependent methyltransferase [Streptomyces sp. MNU76]|uniref:class I SAM-dependent methyltransferase n=1 Tax=Streptomyces sp. MNU76 TaxID=2560026 RepID=UPI001E3495FA|nr:class I SAM-dependent methyltransferase [Streptomyces sp. MNU76]MCC9711765.1 class I SAM-dependent methyltransferase [Streptomyces sp. MNU76]
MTSASQDLVNDFGEEQPIGARHYRAWVGPPEYYDRIGALQFTTLARMGLREHHKLLDVGCGSLRGGRLSIMYLRPGHYFGIEPTAWALEDGKRAHLGEELLAMKKPAFSNDADYTLTEFGETFDFILVHSVFAHAPAVQIRRCMQEARKVMGKQSVLLATYLESDEDHVGDEWVYPWVTEFRPETITQIVTEAGLKCVHLDLPHPFDQRWFAVVDPENDMDLAARAAGSEFTYETHLQDKLRHFGVRHRSYADYLRDDLEKRTEDRTPR